MVGPILISYIYNKCKKPFARRATLNDVIDILEGNEVHGVSEDEIIAIAKAICAGAKVVCPIVEQQPVKSDD